MAGQLQLRSWTIDAQEPARKLLDGVNRHLNPRGLSLEVRIERADDDARVIRTY